MKIKITDVEKALGVKVKRNSKSLGIDLATTTGICLIRSNGTNMELDYSILQFSSQKAIRYEQVVDFFKILIQDNMFVVIEDTFAGINRMVCLLLSRLGGIPLCLSILAKDRNVQYAIIGPTSARSKIGMNPKSFEKGKSKEGVIKWLNAKLDLKIKDDNEADATVLALLGIIEGMDFRPKGKK